MMLLFLNNCNYSRIEKDLKVFKVNGFLLCTKIRSHELLASRTFLNPEKRNFFYMTDHKYICNLEEQILNHWFRFCRILLKGVKGDIVTPGFSLSRYLYLSNARSCVSIGALWLTRFFKNEIWAAPRQSQIKKIPNITHQKPFTTVSVCNRVYHRTKAGLLKGVDQIFRLASEWTDIKFWPSIVTNLESAILLKGAKWDIATPGFSF